MVGLPGSTVLTRIDALLYEDAARSVISLSRARKIGLPALPTYEGTTSLTVPIHGDPGLVLFKNVDADVARLLPAGLPLPTNVGVVLGQDVIECGELVRYQGDGSDMWFLFIVDTGTGILPLNPYTPGQASP